MNVISIRDAEHPPASGQVWRSNGNTYMLVKYGELWQLVNLYDGTVHREGADPTMVVQEMKRFYGTVSIRTEQ